MGSGATSTSSSSWGGGGCDGGRGTSSSSTSSTSGGGGRDGGRGGTSSSSFSEYESDGGLVDGIPSGTSISDAADPIGVLGVLDRGDLGSAIEGLLRDLRRAKKIAAPITKTTNEHIETTIAVASTLRAPGDFVGEVVGDVPRIDGFDDGRDEEYEGEICGDADGGSV